MSTALPKHICILKYTSSFCQIYFEITLSVLKHTHISCPPTYVFCNIPLWLEVHNFIPDVRFETLLWFMKYKDTIVLAGWTPLRYAFVFWNPSLSFEILECVWNHCTKSSFVFWNPSLFFKILECVWNHCTKSSFVFWNPVLAYKIQRHYRIDGLNPLRYVFVFWNLSLSFEILECVWNHCSNSSFVFWNLSLFFKLLVCVWNLGLKSSFAFWSPFMCFEILVCVFIRQSFFLVIQNIGF